jgi:hypothetical protein
MQDRAEELLEKDLVVINLGLRSFSESLEQQGIDVVQVDWAPPAGGDEEMMALLEKLL